MKTNKSENKETTETTERESSASSSVRRCLIAFKKIPKNHRFFCRKSQHYVLGNWAEYAKREIMFNHDAPNHKAKLGNYKFYKRYFLIAYIKFIILCFKDDYRQSNFA